MKNDYVPFGAEWEKDLNKLPKKALISLFKNLCLKNIEQAEALKKVQKEKLK